MVPAVCVLQAVCVCAYVCVTPSVAWSTAQSFSANSSLRGRLLGGMLRLIVDPRSAHRQAHVSYNLMHFKGPSIISLLKCLKRPRMVLYSLLSCGLQLSWILPTMFQTGEIYVLIQGNGAFHLVTCRYNSIIVITRKSVNTTIRRGAICKSICWIHTPNKEWAAYRQSNR